MTGASGFIGKHLVKALEARGDIVQPLAHKSFRDEVSLKIIEGLHDIDYIFHLASYGNMASQRDEGEILRANIDSLWNLLQATKLIPYKAFVNVSSSSVTLPHQTIYAATKLGGEALCRAFRDEYHKPIVSVRPYSIYGPGEALSRFIPTVFRSCLKGEEMVLAEGSHDWTYVSDFVEFMLKVSKTQSLSTSDIPLFAFASGTGISTTNLEVVQLIEKITGKVANVVERKKLRSFDTGSWKAEYVNPDSMHLEEGLQLYYDSIKND